MISGRLERGNISVTAVLENFLFSAALPIYLFPSVRMSFINSLLAPVITWMCISN